MQEELLIADLPRAENKESRERPSISLPRAEIGDESFSPQKVDAAAKRDHWEQEKEKFSLALTERILRGRDSIAFSELKKAPVFSDKTLAKAGEIVLALLRNRARQIIKQEKPLVLQSKRRFDLDDAGIREQLRRLRNSLAERLVVEKNELHAALAFAVRLQFDLITKPAATLERLIYRHSPLRQKDDIFVILQGLDEHHQFIASVQDLLNEYPDGPVTKEAFAALGRRAEREVYGRRTVPALAADLRAYQNFCASIGLSNAFQINNQTVLRMLHERRLTQLAENALPELTQQEWWTIAEIEKLLEQRLASTGLPLTPAPTFAQIEIELSSVLQDAAAEIERQLDGAVTKNTTPDLPIENAPAARSFEDDRKPENVIAEGSESPFNGKEGDRYEAVRESTPPGSADEIDMSIPPELLSSPVIDDAPNVEIEASVETALAALPRIIYQEAEAPLIIDRAKLEAQPPGPYPSMSRLIDEKSRNAFIKKIFHKDLDAYLAFIERLEAMQTWKEAKALLDKEFQTRRVNPYSKEGVHLSDLAFSRYFTKGAK